MAMMIGDIIESYLDESSEAGPEDVVVDPQRLSAAAAAIRAAHARAGEVSYNRARLLEARVVLDDLLALSRAVGRPDLGADLTCTLRQLDQLISDRG